MTNFFIIYITSILQINHLRMQQQLVIDTINIVPQTMDEVLKQIIKILADASLDKPTLDKVVKSLFYGLWNFDKMINQHNLSTQISLIPSQITKKNAIEFYIALFDYLYQKWNLIDHHRINKFMQLVRYLIKEGFNFCKKNKLKYSKFDQILQKTVFKDELSRSGMIYHVADIYFQIMSQVCVANNDQFSLDSLKIFQWLLKNHKIQHFRLHIIQNIYGRYKQLLINLSTSEQQLEEELQQAVTHFMQAAKNEQKDLHRKNFYLMVGYFKSQQISFEKYLQDKEMKASEQKQKIKKKMSKGKKKIIKQMKEKRKQKKKKINKNKKVISKHKLQNNQLASRKFAEQF